MAKKTKAKKAGKKSGESAAEKTAPPAATKPPAAVTAPTTAVAAMVTGKDGQKFVGFNMAPENLIIPGLDTEQTEDKYLLTDTFRLSKPVKPGLVRSVYNGGVRLAVTARMVDKVAEVVDGRQRVRAAREANKLRKEKGQEPILVPVIFQKLEDREAFAAMIETNEHRLNDPPLVKARKALRLIQTGYTRQMVAEIFDVTPVAVADWEKLTQLDGKVIEAIEKERIPFTAAIQLARFKREEQVAEMEKAIASGASASAIREEAQRRSRENTPPGSNGGGGDGETQERGTKIGTRVLRKLVKAQDDGEVDYDPAAYKAFCFVLGATPARQIKGLTDALKTVGFEEVGA